MAGDFFQFGQLSDLTFDDGEVVGIQVLINVFDDEDVGLGEVLAERGANCLRSAGDNLAFVPAEAVDFLSEEQVGWFGDGDGE